MNRTYDFLPGEIEVLEWEIDGSWVDIYYRTAQDSPETERTSPELPHEFREYLDLSSLNAGTV